MGYIGWRLSVSDKNGSSVVEQWTSVSPCYLVTTAVSNSSGGVPAAGGPGPDCSAADDAGGAKWRVMDTRTNMFWNTPW